MATKNEIQEIEKLIMNNYYTECGFTDAAKAILSAGYRKSDAVLDEAIEKINMLDYLSPPAKNSALDYVPKYKVICILESMKQKGNSSEKDIEITCDPKVWQEIQDIGKNEL